VRTTVARPVAAIRSATSSAPTLRAALSLET
jgi:hypothetical protein